MTKKSTSVKNVKKFQKRGRPGKALITIMESIEYADLLIKNRSKIEACLPCLTKKQESMLAAQMYLTMNPDTPISYLAAKYKLSRWTIYRLADLIKMKKLPYRTSQRMICKMVEREWFGRETAIGKMTATASRKRGQRAQQKKK